MHASGFSRGNRDLYKCKNCQAIYCYPMPSLENLEEDYAIESDYEFVSQNAFRVLTFKKHLEWLERTIQFEKKNAITITINYKLSFTSCVLINSCKKIFKYF